MARRLHRFDTPDRFVAGTVGQPGQRTFYLQARDGARIVSASLEKIQVAALADRLEALLEELERRGVAPAGDTPPPADVRPLDEPLNEAFRAGTLTIGWDPGEGSIVIEALDIEADETDDADVGDIDDDDPDGPDLLRVRLDLPQARAFIERARRIVAAGRPPCPLCGRPLDPGGHICPRRNGTYLN
jgi:uncharacterized repeat protein (TIGR03847 family)